MKDRRPAEHALKINQRFADSNPGPGFKPEFANRFFVTAGPFLDDGDAIA